MKKLGIIFLCIFCTATQGASRNNLYLNTIVSSVISVTYEINSENPWISINKNTNQPVKVSITAVDDNSLNTNQIDKIAKEYRLSKTRKNLIMLSEGIMQKDVVITIASL